MNFKGSRCLLISFLFFVNLINSQIIPDSIKKKTFNELREGFNKLDEGDTSVLKIYAKAYLTKGKKEKDTLNIAKGYHYFYYINKKSNIGQRYLDSIINLTEDKNYEYYPLIALNLKSRFYFKEHDYKNSLKYLFKLKEINENQYYKEDVEFQINHTIGLIKSRLGDYDEALRIFLRNEKNVSNKENYLATMFAIADSYRFLKKLDSSSFYNSKGIRISLKQKNNKFYNYFLLNEGATLSDKTFYERSIDSIKKSLKNIIDIGDRKNIAMAYYFLGKNNYILNNKVEALGYFKKMDSIFFVTKDIHPELRRGYEILIRESKLNNNVNDEIYYINRLLDLDNILSNNYKVLSKKITLEFDTPRLLAKKDALIKKMESSKMKSNRIVFTLIIFVVIILTYLIKLNQKKKKYKRKLEDLLSKKKASKEISVSNDKKEESKNLGISSKTILSILKSLEEFEKSEGYLDSKITAYDLAKKINTNTQYLSKIINYYKKENFSNYINNLRVDFIIDKLINDKRYRNYTIYAIAQEAGFNNAESFSSAFVKKTGIKPSYFIKNIDKYDLNL
nr:helix-turn-helix transcriptional regulator [Tenacibaculum mesophilum]